MSVTLATIRPELAKSYLAYPSGVSFTTTGAGAAGGTTAVCSTFAGLTDTDDTYNSWWILLTSGTYGATGTVAARERLITDFAQSTGTFTFAAYGGQVAASVTFEIYNYQPSSLLHHINKAAQLAYPSFMKRWDDRNLVAGNMIPGHFEDWTSSSVPDGWTAGSNCTITEETTIKRFGTSSAKIVRASSTGAGISITSATIPLLLDNTQLDFYGWGYAAAASTAQLKLTPNTGTAGTSGYHTGDSVWRFLEIEGYSVPSTATTLTASFEVDTAATVYADNLAVFGLPVYEYLLPSGITKVNQVFLGNDWEEYEYQDDYELNGWTYYQLNGSYYLRFNVAPPGKRKLRVVGLGYFTSLSSDTDSWTIDDKQSAILQTGAAGLLYKGMARGKGREDRERLLDDSGELLKEFYAGLAMNAMPQPSVKRYGGLDGWA